MSLFQSFQLYSILSPHLAFSPSNNHHHRLPPTTATNNCHHQPPPTTATINHHQQLLRGGTASTSHMSAAGSASAFQETYTCLLRNLFEEYRFFQQYPDKELILTATLFGGIIDLGFTRIETGQNPGYLTLIHALRLVLESLKKHPSHSKMFLFGVTALNHFKTKLVVVGLWCFYGGDFMVFLWGDFMVFLWGDFMVFLWGDFMVFLWGDFMVFLWGDFMVFLWGDFMVFSWLVMS